MALEFSVWPDGAVEQLRAMAMSLMAASGRLGDAEKHQLLVYAEATVLRGFDHVEIEACVTHVLTDVNQSAPEGEDGARRSSHTAASADRRAPSRPGRTPGSGDPEQHRHRRYELLTLGRTANLNGTFGRYRDAIAALTSLSSSWNRDFGSDDPGSLANALDLAWWHAEDGDVESAYSHVASLLPTATRVLGAESPTTLQAQHLHIDLLARLGRMSPERAAVELAELCAVQGAVTGSSHLDTCRTANCAAMWSVESGAAASAVGALEDVWERQLRTYGADHPEVLLTVIEDADVAVMVGADGSDVTKTLSA